MNSKKITIGLGLAILLSATAVSSCDITLYPEDTITPDSYFRNETDLQLFTNTFYTYLPGVDIYADEADIIINPMLKDAISGQRIIPETSSSVMGGWGWTLLRQINYFLANSHNCDDEQVRNHYNGIARFFRAYFYYCKVRMYGDVPWYDQVIGSADKELLNKPRDSRKLVMDNVLADLDYAIDNIRPNKEIYRISKWSAMALKSRIMLFEGTYRKYHNLGDWEKCLNECVSASEELIQTSGYKLYNKGATPYRSLFNTLQATETSDEVILARDYNNSVAIRHSVQNYTTSATAGCGGVTRRLVDAYLMKDGSRHTDVPGYETMSFVEECKNRDPRMAQTLRTPGYTHAGVPAAPDLNSAKLGYQLIKYYIDPKYDGFSEVDLPVFRLAEIYLNFAEAKAELGTLTQTDLDNTVNLIRKRAGVTGELNLVNANANPDPWLQTEQFGYPNLVKNAAAYNNTANLGVILEIRRERTIELVMEGFRYWDIMRWKEGKVFDQPFVGMYIGGAGLYDLNGDGKPDYNIATDSDNGNPDAGAPTFKTGEKINLSQGDKGYLIMHKDLPRSWKEERDYLYPLPTQDRILTNGALTQNPGWDDSLKF